MSCLDYFYMIWMYKGHISTVDQLYILSLGFQQSLSPKPFHFCFVDCMLLYQFSEQSCKVKSMVKFMVIF